MKSMDKVMYVVKPRDNVATALADIAPGTVCLRGAITGEFEVLDAIPFGHKVALKDIKEGEDIIKYAARVAVASKDIEKGRYVHIHNAKSMQDTRSNAFVSSSDEGAVTADRSYWLEGAEQI